MKTWNLEEDWMCGKLSNFILKSFFLKKKKKAVQHSLGLMILLLHNSLPVEVLFFS